MRKSMALYIIAAVSFAQSPKIKTPRAIMEQFVALDAQGRQLDPTGWEEISAFFVRPSTKRETDILVISEDYAVSNAKVTGSEAEVYVQFREWGVLDPSARFVPDGDHPGAVRSKYKLILTDTHWEFEPDGTIRNVNGPRAWKIEGSPRMPAITVKSAIQYLKATSEKSSDPVFRQNAEKTIKILRTIN